MVEQTGQWPPLHRLRSYTEKEENNYTNLSWEKCTSKLNKQNLQLHIHKIKCYNEGKLTQTMYSGVLEYESDDDIGTYFNIKSGWPIQMLQLHKGNNKITEHQRER